MKLVHDLLGEHRCLFEEEVKHLAPAAQKIRKPEPPSFEVVCVVGTVEVGGGDESPHMAAFRLIAEHDAPGTYSFPNAWGETTTVEVNGQPSG